MRFLTIVLFSLLVSGFCFSQETELRKFPNVTYSLDGLSNFQRYGVDYDIPSLNSVNDIEPQLLNAIPLSEYEKMRLSDADRTIHCDVIQMEITIYSHTKTLNQIEAQNIRVSRVEGAKTTTYELE